jgi:hypothetical protein
VVDVDALRRADRSSARAAVGFTPRGMPKPTIKRAPGPLVMLTMGEPGTGVAMREFKQPVRGGRDAEAEAASYGAVSAQEQRPNQRKVRRQPELAKEKKPLLCGYCDLSFPWNAGMNLVEHQVAVHRATPPTSEQYCITPTCSPGRHGQADK